MADHRPETVTLTWDDYVALEDRAAFAEDRLRIIRKQLRRARGRLVKVTWNLWVLHSVVQAIMWATSEDTDGEPENPLP
jgi:hypothetical protein